MKHEDSDDSETVDAENAGEEVKEEEKEEGDEDEEAAAAAEEEEEEEEKEEEEEEEAEEEDKEEQEGNARGSKNKRFFIFLKTFHQVIHSLSNLYVMLNVIHYI